MISLQDVERIVRGHVDRLNGRLRGLVRRGILGAVTPGLGVAAQVKSTSGDVDDDVELFQQYGFYSIPNGGAECVLLRAGGAREHTIAILPGDRTTSPVGVAPGEVAVYHPSGSQIVMRTDGSIEVTPAPGQVAKLGGPEAVLEVARRTDPVFPTEAGMAAWALAVEAALSVAASPIAPAAAWAAIVGPPGGPYNFATIAAGGTGATCT